MRALVDRVGPVRLWAIVVVGLATLIAVLALAFPQRVYVDVIWQYFWGPVVADAHGWACIDWAGGDQVECAGDPAGPTAEPGYTLISYSGYIPTLILLLVGIYFLVDRLEIERYRAGFYALFPFMLFGGALRVVEDANVAAYRETGDLAIQLPWSGFLISPLIYFLVFAIALVAVVVSVWLERRGHVAGYEYPLAAIGTVALAVTLAYLSGLALTTDYATFYPLIPTVVLVGATVATALTWHAIERFSPELNAGTQYTGIVIIWAHAVDGVANVIGLNWAVDLGLPQNLTPKHPLNEAIVTYTGQLLPASVVSVTGDAWPFLLVKLAAAVVIIWIFDESIFEDSPMFTYLLLITVVAVGLGPGTRDMLRATFGV